MCRAFGQGRGKESANLYRSDRRVCSQRSNLFICGIGNNNGHASQGVDQLLRQCRMALQRLLLRLRNTSAPVGGLGSIETEGTIGNGQM